MQALYQRIKTVESCFNLRFHSEILFGEANESNNEQS